ncbi:hypothetical protein DFH08DRAFT_932889 [Mycena albidolilacea]|uniref:Uncharacterized protein n=1 Tax=Mycena albidolilacea TaxID=1033008 RepID=A0AAD7AEW1_9AGAR|nr:hypothetical protein DFH08DRAFT_932889 [Mycena albidolilacea]
MKGVYSWVMSWHWKKRPLQALVEGTQRVLQKRAAVWMVPKCTQGSVLNVGMAQRVIAAAGMRCALAVGKGCGVACRGCCTCYSWSLKRWGTTVACGVHAAGIARRIGSRRQAEAGSTGVRIPSGTSHRAERRQETGAAGAADDAGTAHRPEWDGPEDVAASAEAASGTPARRNGRGRALGTPVVAPGMRPGASAERWGRNPGEDGHGVPAEDECCRRRGCVAPASDGAEGSWGCARGAGVEGESGAAPEIVIAGGRRGKRCMRWGNGRMGGVRGSGVEGVDVVQRRRRCTARVVRSYGEVVGTGRIEQAASGFVIASRSVSGSCRRPAQGASSPGGRSACRIRRSREAGKSDGRTKGCSRRMAENDGTTYTTSKKQEGEEKEG